MGASSAPASCRPGPASTSATCSSPRLQRPIFADNESNCSALAEMTWGAAVGEEDFVFFTVDVGVGGAIVAKGRVLTGRRRRRRRIRPHDDRPRGRPLPLRQSRLPGADRELFARACGRLALAWASGRDRRIRPASACRPCRFRASRRGHRPQGWARPRHDRRGAEPRSGHRRRARRGRRRNAAGAAAPRL